MKKYDLWYKEPAPMGNEDFSLYKRGKDIPDDGWEKWSLPIGNGYMGVNIFGRTVTERLQITENSLSNPYAKGAGGLNNFCELYIDFNHENVKNYRRGLNLNEAISYVEYECGGVFYKREYFTSYPDKVFAARFGADKPGALSFTLHPEIPFVKPYLFEEGDGMGKSGSVSAEGNVVTFSGKMEYYNIIFEGQTAVKTKGGTIKSENGKITVLGADEATVITAVGTNYKLCSDVFCERDPKKKLEKYDAPHEKVSEIIEKAAEKDYELLRKRHIDDFSEILGRAAIDLGGVYEDRPTDELLADYRNGKRSRYLEEMYFQFGRYLLISSSRPGTYPANLQGTWNKYDSSPWSSGYWHNINVQMNYWPAFNTNLIDMFEPYAEYFKAYLPLAEDLASDYVSRHFPENHEEGKGRDGWIIGTGAWLYTIFGMDEPFSGHSGPGTGGFTSKLFWDYYEFTQDTDILENLAYPAVLSMSRFLSKVVIEKDGKYLAKYSASPEQEHNGKHYYTTGCAFDQQMIYENYNDTLKGARILGDNDALLETVREQIGKLDPVLIGKSGQIKEFREEEYYGDIGEYHHRHISQLIGLCPGTLINRNHPDWIKAAEVSLTERGDESTGWSTAHKINAWARVKNGNRAYDLLKMILSKCTLNNLWDTHPPFQIDGNFGATAGIAEMLMQSHEGYVHLLPALPDEWGTGDFSGLTARGAFEIGAKWENKRITHISVKAKQGGMCRIYLGEGYKCSEYKLKDGFLEFETEKGREYVITVE